MHLTTKEASAYGLVGDFMLCVRDALEKLCPTVEFKIDHQFHVHNAKTYVADSALVSKVVFSIEQIPCFVVEYKPRVAADLSDQEPFHVSEVFLQAYYLRTMQKRPVLHCLTEPSILSLSTS
jgi:hypothetical protein